MHSDIIPSTPAAAAEKHEEEEEGRGTWKHAAFHVATTIATPAAYAPLPFALASLGWPLGVTSLVSGTLATWYSSLLIASLWKWNGKKHITYRELAGSIFGFWGYWSVALFQQVASLGNNIAIQIAAGSSLKAVYKYFREGGSLTLQHFIMFFGAFELVLSQLPNIHSLRWVNALCTFSTIGFAATTIGVTIYDGKKTDRNSISYSLQGSSSRKTFRAFNALGIIAFSFGDAMLPEIQNTMREPARKNMYKGVSAAYGVIILSYWQLASCGYWAFGSEVQPYILSSLSVPEWTIVMANLFAVIQISGCYQIYCRPTYAYFEENMLSSKATGRFPLRKYLVRLIFTSIYMALITLIAAAMPFFGDFVSICGAIGFTPLDFVFPSVAYLKAGRMPKDAKCRLSMQLLNFAIATWFSVVAVLGCIGAVKFIIEDIKTYKFFHDIGRGGGEGVFDILNFATAEEYVSLRQNTNKWKRTFPTIHGVKDHVPGHPELVPVINAVVYAANSGNLVPLRRLDKGLLKMAVCIPDSDGRTLFHYAAATGKTHVSKYFMEQVKVDDVNMKDGRGQTPLHHAILGHYYHSAAYLLENGADPNAANEKGETSLHYAACTGIKRILHLLISKGANVDAISNHGTPLHNAAAHGKKDSVRILLENHADPNVIFHDHVPPLVMAIHANSIECVELLLQAGADPNIRKHGVTPLESASSEGFTEIIKCLLNAGADPNVTSFYGLTPIEIAALQCNYQGVVILFPVTSRIPAIPDWSTVGIMKYIHSEEATQQMNRKLKENFLTLKSKGEDAFKRKDYLGAICWYTEAINADPSDATVLSNRSLCWARLNEGSRALSDAGACIALRPDWPKAYYREGVAYRLLKDFVKSSYSFSKALELDPKNEELQKAFWEAVGFVIR